MEYYLSNTANICDLRSGDKLSATGLQFQVTVRRNHLLELGLKPLDKVVVAHGGSPDFFIDLFALWSLRSCAVCINPGVTKAELNNITDFVSANLVLVADDMPGETNAAQHVNLQQETSLEHIKPEPCDFIDRLTLRPDDPALILFTSGTTGNPRAVMHSVRTLNARIQLNRTHIKLGALARSLCVLPTHFGHGLIGNCLTPLFSGGQLFLYTSPSVAELAGLGKLLDDTEISFLSSVPAFWKMVHKLAAAPQAHHLKQVNVGSAPLSAALWQDIIDWSGCQNVNNMYGITETANWVAGASAEEYQPEDGVVGRMWGGQAALLLEGGNIAKYGRGEILLDSPSIMEGYFQRQDLTDLVKKDHWYRTGDLGEISKEGVIKIVDRLKSEINHAGIKIYPEEIDLLMERHEAVAEACSFGVPDDIAGERVGIAILPASPATRGITVERLKNWCAERIRKECVPEIWFLVDAIPKTELGKVKRREMYQYCLEQEAQAVETK